MWDCRPHPEEAGTGFANKTGTGEDKQMAQSALQTLVEVMSSNEKLEERGWDVSDLLQAGEIEVEVMSVDVQVAFTDLRDAISDRSNPTKAVKALHSVLSKF